MSDDKLKLKAGMSCGRLIVSFVIGLFYGIESLCGPIEGLGVPFAFMFFALATALGLGAAALAGRPLRGRSKLALYWQSRSWPGVAMIAMALCLWVFARLPSMVHRMPDPELGQFMISVPNRWVGLIGWLLLLFGMVNYTPGSPARAKPDVASP